MPIYALRCPSCDAEEDRLMKLSQRDTIVNCKCGYKMQRVVSTYSFILKGEGFYINDYKRSNKNEKQ